MTETDGGEDPGLSWLTRSARKITLWVLLFAALLFVLVITLITVTADKSLERELVNGNTAVAGLAKEVVDEHLATFAASAELFAQRPLLRQAVRNGDAGHVRQHLRALVETHRDNDRAFVADADGILRFDYPEDPAVIDVDFSYRAWYRGVSAAQDTHLSPMYQRAALGAPYVVAIAVPLQDDDGSTFGYLVVQRTVERLAQWVSRYHSRPGGTIRVFDRTGTVAWTSGVESGHPWADHPVVHEALSGRSGTRRAIDPETGEASLMSYAPVERIGWGVVVSRPWNETFAPVHALTRNIIGFAAVALLILGGLCYYWLRTLFQYERALLARNEIIERDATQLERANQELDAFTYSVSHDLRAPLRATDGFSRILEEEYGDALPEKARHYLGMVRENSVQMRLLVDDLLEFSRLDRQTLARRPVEPDAIVDQVLAGLDAGEPGNSDIRRSRLPPCEADPSLLKQVFANLIDNALKYSRHREQPVIEIGADTIDGAVQYYVSDNGAGFDMAYADRIFGVFQRLHRSEDFPGTGIGLAVVQRIVRRHGGSIRVESKPDHGTTFHFTLGP